MDFLYLSVAKPNPLEKFFNSGDFDLLETPSQSQEESASSEEDAEMNDARRVEQAEDEVS